MRRFLGGLMLCGLSLAACDGAEESQPEAEPLGEARAAFSAANFAWFNVTGGSSGTTLHTFNVDPAGTNGISFLYGLVGNLGGTGYPHVSTYKSSDGSTKLAINVAANLTLGAGAVSLIPGRSSFEDVGSYSTTGSNFTWNLSWLPASASRRCFLTTVWSVDVYGNDSYFQDELDRIEIYKDGSTWKVASRHHAYADFGCISVSQYLGSAGQAAPSFAPAIVNLGPEQPGKICVLTGIGGQFRSNSTTNGVYLRIRNGDWELVISPGKYGRADCML